MNNVIEYLMATAQKFPTKVALADASGTMTFSELNSMAKRIATGIIEKTGGKANRPIAVMLPKGKECIAAFMGVLYSGNFYSPIDLSMPQTRIDLILDKLEPILIITKDESISNDKRLFSYTELGNNSVDEQNILLQMKKVLSVDPVYVLFTSGSTGTPKGVVVSHASVIDYTEWLKNTFDFNENTVFGNQAPLYFDNSILDIYSCMKNGSTIQFIEERLFAFPRQLMDFLNRKRVNTIFWVPSALIGVANSGILDSLGKTPPIRQILFCGEVMPTKQLKIWMRAFKECRFANLYGPTEITDVCTYFIVDRIYEEDESLPIGKACENTEILIINEKGDVAKVNEKGEILVRGIGVSKGYYKDTERSDKVFIQNPAQHDYRDIVYRTGDVGLINEEGNIIYIGRKDNQIKYQGHRIELGEIESAAIAIEGTRRACAVFSNTENKIVLYATIMEKEKLTAKEIYAELKKRLPKYMLPSKIEILEEMPLNVNGKIDRVKLLKEYENGSDNKKYY